MDITVIIPIRSYLKKYVACKVGCVDPLVMSAGKHFIPEYLFSVFETYSIKFDVRKNEVRKMNDLLHVKLPVSFAYTGKIYLSENHICKIDSFLKQTFNSSLYDYLDDRYEQKGDIKKQVINFLDKYKITETDISLDTIVKRYYRHRVKILSKSA